MARRGSSDCGASFIPSHGSPRSASLSGTLAIVSSSGCTASISSHVTGAETCAPARARTDHAPKTVLWGAFWL